MPSLITRSTVIVVLLGPGCKLVRGQAPEAGMRSAGIVIAAPCENAFVESFNGRFRDECLNEHVFRGSPNGAPDHRSQDGVRSQLGAVVADGSSVRACRGPVCDRRLDLSIA
jgi:hypothetical protein